ncbi:DUF4391 domain-containing protein [Zoogloea sp.]|uniref:DUF4391 domain-containing protein n=1 Tax=Zoogloea sp. TaxID=49181 RepID=UPI00260C676F|nr:DUF4391 domain-containing protein [uncultured Zoogloea sp.]
MTTTIDLPSLIAALGLPEGAAVKQRIPKKMLLETGAPTAADKRTLADGIDDIQWLAALKPVTVGIPAYHDELREYLEIVVLSLTLRPEARGGRIAELVHRAIPYPVLLIAHSEAGVGLSLAHKRWAHNEAGKTVLDGDVLEASLQAPARPELTRQFVDALALDKQPRLSLHALYQGWMDRVIALQTALVTGVFAVSASREHAAARHRALREVMRLRAEIERLKGMAGNEKQINRRVGINLELQALQSELKAAHEQL